jgi:hypothetical protein
MKKWIIAGALIILVVGAQTGTSEATNHMMGIPFLNEAEEVEQPLVEVLVPQTDRVTSRETMMVSFRAPQNSQVTVEVFHNASLTDEENFTALYEPMVFEIGVLERGWVELKLKKGVNRIVLTATIARQGQESALEVIERKITVKDLEEVREELTRSVMQTTATDLIRKLTNMDRFIQSME